MNTHQNATITHLWRTQLAASEARAEAERRAVIEQIYTGIQGGLTVAQAVTNVSRDMPQGFADVSDLITFTEWEGAEDHPTPNLFLLGEPF